MVLGFWDPKMLTAPSSQALEVREFHSGWWGWTGPPRAEVLSPSGMFFFTFLAGSCRGGHLSVNLNPHIIPVAMSFPA